MPWAKQKQFDQVSVPTLHLSGNTISDDKSKNTPGAGGIFALGARHPGTAGLSHEGYEVLTPPVGPQIAHVKVRPASIIQPT